MQTISERDGALSGSGLGPTPSETEHNILETRSTPSPTPSNAMNESTGLSGGATAGIAIAVVCGVAAVAVGFFLYFRLRKRSPRSRLNSLEGGSQTSIKSKQQLQEEKQHRDEEEQLQQQLQQMQLQLQDQKVREQEMEQKQLVREHQELQEESRYMAEFHELPGWLPDPSDAPCELADTCCPRYEMMTQANTAELCSGDPEQCAIALERLHHLRRSRSNTAELSGEPPFDAAAARLLASPRKRSLSDAGPVISATVSPESNGRAFSPIELSPPLAPLPRIVFTDGDWRTMGSGATIPMSSFNSHPAIPLGLSLGAAGGSLPGSKERLGKGQWPEMAVRAPQRQG
jgi:hypothetical protein